MHNAHRQQLLETYRTGLLEDVIPFWIAHGWDEEHGGICTALNRDGTLLDTDKCVWQQGRFAWLLGELCNSPLTADNPQRERWLDLAIRTADFMVNHCFDPGDGRMWFQVTRSGAPIRKRRYSFSESFAAIAFGELAHATGESRYAELATTCFQQFVNQHRATDAATAKFTDTRPSKSIGFPMILINTAQQLRDSIQLDGADEWIDRAVQEIRDDFLKPELRSVMETVGSNGQILNHFDGRTLNPGHAIEGAWFLMEEGRVREDRELIETGCQMLEWMWERGWDPEYGGMLYFVSIDGNPIQEYWHDMKFWWPQNETIIATLMAYRLTRDDRYLDWHSKIHHWAHRHFPDPSLGEWYGYLHRDGSISSTAKGNFWKGPFHLPRMQLICWALLKQ